MTEEDPLKDYCKIFLPGASHEYSGGDHLYSIPHIPLYDKRDYFALPPMDRIRPEYRYGLYVDPSMHGLTLVIPKKWAYKALGLEEPKNEAPRCPWCGGLIAAGEKKCTFCGGKL